MSLTKVLRVGIIVDVKTILYGVNMKLLIASDIHGDIESARILVEAFEREGCDKMLLLGDILYHGPRNDLPGRYAPKEVIALLNVYKEKILAVRGNCDTEVDQMVLEFPILADYALLALDGLSVYATHGHNYNTKTPPPMAEGDILLHGHTHVIRAEKVGNNNTYIILHSEKANLLLLIWMAKVFLQ